jgi:hypothetical protein
MGIGSGAGDTLRVDPEMLSQLGSQLETSARALPEAPAPFTVTGSDAISAAIAEKLPALETPIIEGLPAVKQAAAQTASNIVAAAGKYQGTDEELAAAYEKQQFGGGGVGGAAGGAAGVAAGAAASAGAGAAGAGGGAMGQMGQLMSMPMQMASQAAQMPQQAMGAVSQIPQAGMQGAQQIVQMATGAGKDAGGAADPQTAERQAEERERDEAAGGKHRERAPIDEAPLSDSVVPDSGAAGPRHAAPDTPVDL